MTTRELAFVRSAARGLRRAREALSGPGAANALADAFEQMFEDHPGRLTNEEVAYFAAMLVQWEDLGHPDLFT